MEFDLGLLLWHARYFLVGLAIWVTPGLVFWGFMASTYPSRGGNYSNSFMFVVFLLFFIGTVLGMPLLIFYVGPHWVNPMIPVGTALFFGIAYGLLILHYWKTRKKEGPLSGDREKQLSEEFPKNKKSEPLHRKCYSSARALYSL